MELEDEETNELVVRPDGKAPRVKSNIKAKLANKGHSLTKHKVIQSTLGFETLDKAAALGLETATP